MMVQRMSSVRSRSLQEEIASSKSETGDSLIETYLQGREGNGTPLLHSCLENPMDGGAWWAAVYGVTQSWPRLKRLSSSSSMYRARLKVIDKEW